MSDARTVALPADVVRRLFAYAQSADHAGLLDKCEDHLVADGDGCEVCTDLEAVQAALWRLAEAALTVHPAVPVLAEHEVTRWSRQGTLAHCICGTAVSCTDAGDEYAAHLAEMLAAAGILPADPATHVYLSTGCLHGDHGYCQATVGGVGRKTPATCKFCGAPCVCDCHQQTGLLAERGDT